MGNVHRSRLSLMLHGAIASALFALTLMPTRSHAKPAPFKVKWLGHAAFQIISSEGTEILVDPFILENPATPKGDKNLAAYRPAAILLSHAHFDHTGDVSAIAKSSGAAVVGEFAHVKSLEIPEEQKIGGNVGGRFKIKELEIHLVPAMHSSPPGGRPLGFVIEFADGRTVYHTGDTWIFGDMSLIQELHSPFLILLNVGGGPFTQDPPTAALAIKKYFSPKAIVPMHYGTFPPLAQPADVEKVFGKDRRVHMLRPGETRTY